MFDLDQLEEFDARLADLASGRPAVGARSDVLMDLSANILSQASEVLADRHARPSKCPMAHLHGVAS